MSGDDRAAAAGDEGDAAVGSAAAAEAAAAELRVTLDALVARLTASGARTEALGAFEQKRSILGIRRGPVLVPITRVWRLGVLLLDAQGGLHEVGAVTRAIDPGRVTNQSPRAEERRDYRRAAYQGKFQRGDTVNYDTTPIALDAASLRAGSGPLALADIGGHGNGTGDSDREADGDRDAGGDRNAADDGGGDGGTRGSARPTVLVRWNKQPGAAGYTPIAPYLAERAELLTAPPP